MIEWELVHTRTTHVNDRHIYDRTGIFVNSVPNNMQTQYALDSRWHNLSPK